MLYGSPAARFFEGQAMTLRVYDTLKQKKVEILKADSAFDLNLRCYEQAYLLFEELINEITENVNITGTQQNLGEKTYYANYKRPENGCLISWNTDAKEIDAKVRALNFGINDNPIGTAKFLLNNDYIIIEKIKVLDSNSNVKHGTVLDVSDNKIILSTKTNDIEIEKVSNLSGQAISVNDLSAQYDIKKGYYVILETTGPGWAPGFISRRMNDAIKSGLFYFITLNQKH